MYKLYTQGDLKLSIRAQGKTQTLRDSGANPLEQLTVLLRPDLDIVNTAILSRMKSDVPLIPQLAGHLIASGGKRIRPLLTLASTALFAQNCTRQHRLAASVEFIHTATLLHDDVVDESLQRRGKASANAIFGNEASVLVGDFLFSRAFQLMVEDGSLDVLRILSKASAVIAEGEVLQLSTTSNIDSTKDQYLSVVKAKTAELFAAACEIGAVITDRSAEEAAALRDYGMNLGIAFQMADDVLDYASTTEAIGKEVGDDFKEGKMTLPVVLALEKADAVERTFWQRSFAELDQAEGDFETACEIIKTHDCCAAGLQMAKTYAAAAQGALEKLPECEIRDLMGALADFSVERSF